MGRIVFLIVAAILIAAFVVWATRISGRPEKTASHGLREDRVGADTDSDRFYEGVDRPAGPDAETTGEPGAGIRGQDSPPGEAVQPDIPPAGEER